MGSFYRPSKNRGTLPNDMGQRELGAVMAALEMGTLMTQYKKGVGNEKLFHLDLSRFKICWHRPGSSVVGGTDEGGSLCVEDIKHIRCGLDSKDFQSVARKMDSTECCLVIDYGTSFRLKTLSCLTQNGQERDFWLRGLSYLIGREGAITPAGTYCFIRII